MPIDLDDEDLKHGLLGLVIALVEIIRDTLKIQAVKRMESGGLADEEVERLGKALMKFDTAIDQIKEEQGITESVRSVRDGLDQVITDIVNKMIPHSDRV